MVPPFFVPFLLTQQVDFGELRLGQVTEFKYPALMRMTKIQGDIELTATIKNGSIISITANKPDPPNSRPIIREMSEKIFRSLQLWDKISGTLKIKFVFKILPPTNKRISRVTIDPDNNEFLYEASELQVD